MDPAAKSSKNGITQAKDTPKCVAVCGEFKDSLTLESPAVCFNAGVCTKIKDCEKRRLQAAAPVEQVNEEATAAANTAKDSQEVVASSSTSGTSQRRSNCSSKHSKRLTRSGCKQQHQWNKSTKKQLQQQTQQKTHKKWLQAAAPVEQVNEEATAAANTAK